MQLIGKSILAMKKLSFILAALAMVGVACNKQETIENNTTPEEETKEMVRIELKVSVDPETRATMDGLDLKFGVDDEISVLGTSGSTTDIYYLTAESVDQSTGVITFSTSVPADVEIGDYAYYPSDIMAPSGSDPIDPLLICWPSMIYCSEGVKIPMIAPIDLTNNTAEFKHLGVMLKVNLTNTPADFSWLEFRTSAKFGGWYEVNPSDFSMNLVDDPSNLNWEVIQGIGDGVYYIPIPAGSYSNFQLGMMSEDPTGYPYGYCKQRTANLENPIAPERGQIVNLGNFTYDVDEIAEWWFKNPTNKWGAGYNRFIKTGATTYQLIVFNPSSDPWWSLWDGEGNQWGASNVTAWTSSISKVANTFHREGANDKTFWVTLSKNGNNWDYNSGNWENNCTREWATNAVSMSTSLDLNADNDWDNFTFTKYNYGANYTYKYENFEIPDSNEYEFKFILNGSWSGGNVSLTDAVPYSKCTLGGGDNMKFRLTPGKYDIYIDVAELNFMFVKQPIVYDPGLTPQP